MKYCERFQKCLIDPTEEQSFEHDPLTAFSYFLSGRVNVLCSFAQEIIENLDKGFASKCIDGKTVERAESLMWLWLLGAYEVVRTMHQAKPCFSQRLVLDLQGLKQALAIARMPAAKMEKPGKKTPVVSSRSPSGWDMVNRDLLVNDPLEDVSISARWLLSEFDRVFCSITRSDVLAPHEASYLSP
ncbi:hypothetical protein WAE56_14380 [Iodobacter sp. LRB]|uniref:hypothetical protein n=1 Tax=unclassified Iodobacter TaxID=235634 RepID=UPI000C0C8818|nr:hypothetical protein [Iodobacter sp. BJB302]PHV00703.1 hypothetical protein CSQ88_15805 [Iodobacter sp. BJB302]